MKKALVLALMTGAAALTTPAFAADEAGEATLVAMPGEDAGEAVVDERLTGTDEEQTFDYGEAVDKDVNFDAGEVIDDGSIVDDSEILEVAVRDVEGPEFRGEGGPIFYSLGGADNFADDAAEQSAELAADQVTERVSEQASLATNNNSPSNAQ